MTDHWSDKMKVYFKRIDFDHDGCITKEDFKGMAGRFIEAGKLDEAKGTALTNNLLAMWEKYKSTLAAGDSINQEAFLSSMHKLVDDTTMRATLEAPLPMFFAVIDSNNDGLISKEEYADFFRIIGLPDGLSDAAFTAIDTDKDGQLSLKEFVDAGSDFFLNKSGNHPSDIFWGPLDM